MAPTVDEELILRGQGFGRIAGIDEAGRGCWAGPVVAAAVVLPDHILHNPALLASVDDSKALSAARRDRLYDLIVAQAAGWAVGVVPAHVIDTHGILEATRLAMQVAMLRLARLPDALLIDAVKLPHWPCPQRALIKGDARSLSIAAASVLAKVTRDRLMAALHQHTPQYGFGAHKGYGTAAHYAALRVHGPCVHHRASFRPISEYLASGEWPPVRRVLVQ